MIHCELCGLLAGEAAALAVGVLGKHDFNYTHVTISFVLVAGRKHLPSSCMRIDRGQIDRVRMDRFGSGQIDRSESIAGKFTVSGAGESTTDESPAGELIVSAAGGSTAHRGADTGDAFAAPPAGQHAARHAQVGPHTIVTHFFKFLL